LIAKKVDAAVIQEPFRSSGLLDGSITVVADLTKLDYLDAFPAGPLVAKRAFFEKSPADAKGVRDAMVEALQFIHNNRAGALEIARKTFPGIKPDVLTMAFERESRGFSRDGKFSPKSLARTQEICKQLGIIDTVYSYEDLVAPIAR
jgi:ABC-type nitrate/sulfonate/bicarbonate transport system substrate-binding protein